MAAWVSDWPGTTPVAELNKRGVCLLGLSRAISVDGTMLAALGDYVRRFSQMHGIEAEMVVGERRVPTLSPM